MTPSGIEPVTCRFAAWCLNHYGNELSAPLYSIKNYTDVRSDPSGCALYAAPRLLELCFRIQQGHGCLSVLSVVCCQVEVPSSV